jgi:hypothetical protein
LEAACKTAHAPAEGPKAPSPNAPAPGDEETYARALERYSARGEVYEGLDQRLFVAATYNSPAFVEARVRRRGAFLVQPAQEIEKALADELAAIASSDVVFMGVHANNPRHEDFGRPQSLWRLALASESAETTPTKVERVGRPDENLRSLFPYLREFWVGYWLHFPKLSTGAEKLTLRVASSLGRAELSVRT